ncbi:uncharacterized protein TNCV_3434881 [Trichonephila clavipes]|nr:uncharacterized protein TNCV_3434881 [Trichonephila clavipes]
MFSTRHNWSFFEKNPKENTIVEFATIETNDTTCHTAGLRVGSESSQRVQDEGKGKTLKKLVSFESACCDTIFMGKECVRICNEHTTNQIVPFFSIRMTGCRKLQYDRKLPVKFFNDRFGEMIQNDQRVTLREILSELGLSYDSVQHIVSEVLRYSKTVP